MKNFSLADLSELMAVRVNSSPELQNVKILLSRHDVRRVHERLSLTDLSEVMEVRVIWVS